MYLCRPEELIQPLNAQRWGAAGQEGLGRGSLKKTEVKQALEHGDVGRAGQEGLCRGSLQGRGPDQGLEGAYVGRAGQEGPLKSATAPPAPTSSLRSGAGLAADAWEGNTRAARPLLDSTAYTSSSAPAKAPEAPCSVQGALCGKPSSAYVNSRPLVSDLPPASRLSLLSGRPCVKHAGAHATRWQAAHCLLRRSLADAERGSGGSHALRRKSAALTWAALEEDQAGIPLLAVDQLLCRQRLARRVSGRQRHELVHLALAQAVC